MRDLRATSLFFPVDRQRNAPGRDGGHTPAARPGTWLTDGAVTPPAPVSAPKLPALLEPLDLGAGGLHDELELRGVHLTGAGGDGLAVRNLELTGALLEDVDLGGARLPHLGLRDVRVTGGSLANLDVRGGIVQRSAFERVRLTGFSWHEGTLRDVRFTGCRIDLASFAATRLERVFFEDCSLTECELPDARLAAVSFENCDLTHADLSGATFSARCAMRGCTLDGVRAVERLRGVTMPFEDVLAAAGTFAASLGIRIQTGDEEEDGP
ncbi:MAG: pentapeptide repeat protein [Solirubrobacterales bacterium]|nr:pentapeptide repeat protein [Solirubrobacterales bacterium]